MFRISLFAALLLSTPSFAQTPGEYTKTLADQLREGGVPMTVDFVTDPRRVYPIDVTWTVPRLIIFGHFDRKAVEQAQSRYDILSAAKVSGFRTVEFIGGGNNHWLFELFVEHGCDTSRSLCPKPSSTP